MEQLSSDSCPEEWSQIPIASATFPLATFGRVNAADHEELISCSVMSLSKAIRAGRFTSAQVVTAYLDRIEKVNPKINAVVTLAADNALREASQLDRELADGKLRGMLHGVPMTIKDSFDTAGVVSTAGTMGRREFIPQRDATVVARLRRAGAILLGKTNTPEFTMSYDTRNLIFGFTKNPYDLTKSPGGSSGGAGAIVASAGSPFDMGSDTGGSIRVPSCFCGIAGIKPTTGRMPLTGHIIQTGLGLIDSFTQVGPMARFVDDLYPLLRITAGPDGEDPAVVPVRLRHPKAVQLPELRIAYHTDNGIQAASDEVAGVVSSAVRKLKEAGVTVAEDAPKAIARWSEKRQALGGVGAIDGNKWVKLMLQEAGTQRWDPHIDWHRQTRSYTGEEAGDIVRDLQDFRIEMMRWFQRFDALVCPVNAEASYSSGFDLVANLKNFRYTSAFNSTGWPAAVVRCGTSGGGMPIGVQIVAKPWREDVCLAIAKHLETQLGGWQQTSI